MQISSSYAKILGETNSRTREIPQSGSKAEDGEEKTKKKTKVSDNNGQAKYGARKPPGPTCNNCDHIMGQNVDSNSDPLVEICQ